MSTKSNQYKQSIMVRADHFENGDIVPVAYVNSCGNTTRIDRILSIEKQQDGTVYLCRTGDIEVRLYFDNTLWYLTGSLYIIE